MATKIQKVPGGYKISQFRGVSRAKRTWSKPVRVGDSDPVALRAEIVRQCKESRSIALPDRLQ